MLCIDYSINGVSFHDLFSEFDPSQNIGKSLENVAHFSRQIICWRCRNCNRTWQAPVYYRTAKLTGCPYCSHQKVVPGETDLASIRPDIASIWDYERNDEQKPDQITAYSGLKVWWRCPTCNQSWHARVYSLTKSKTKSHGCPYCAGKIPILGKTDLASQYPDIAYEWDYIQNELTPDKVTAHSNKLAWWLCSACGYSWQAKISNRTSLGRKCPCCTHQKPIFGKTDLASQRPDIAREWDYARNKITPDKVTQHSGRLMWWLCSVCKQSWSARINNRTSVNATGCPFCDGRKPILGINDLATLRPDLAAEWDITRNGKYSPRDFTLHSNHKAFWICSKHGHSWVTSINSRTTQNSKCPCCHGRKSIAKRLI